MPLPHIRVPLRHLLMNCWDGSVMTKRMNLRHCYSRLKSSCLRPRMLVHRVRRLPSMVIIIRDLPEMALVASVAAGLRVAAKHVLRHFSPCRCHPHQHLRLPCPTRCSSQLLCCPYLMICNHHFLDDDFQLLLTCASFLCLAALVVEWRET
jgi:hypothetical protein